MMWLWVQAKSFRRLCVQVVKNTIGLSRNDGTCAKWRNGAGPVGDGPPWGRVGRLLRRGGAPAPVSLSFLTTSFAARLF